MDEMNERLRLVDRLPVPDLWEDARSRTPRLTQFPEAAGIGRRLVVVGVSFALFAVAALGVWQGFRRGPDTSQRTGSPAPAPADVLASLPDGWTDLAAPPDYRCCAAVGWTGAKMLVWSGYSYTGLSDEKPESDGYRLDPISGDTTEIAPAPIAPRSLPASAWTGRELLVWGGWQPGGPPFFGDGAAYDPVQDSWRSLPPSPLSARVPLSVWTGSEWILWGSGVRVDDRPLDGAAYEPASNTWRSIATGPIELTDATAVWTGEEMIVFGAALHGGNQPETPTAIAAAYDPSTDTWRELPPSPLDTNSNTAAWNGNELIALDYNHESAAYDPATNEWRGLSRIPGDQCEGGLSSAVAVEGHVFAVDCGEAFILEAGSSEWIDVTPPGGRGSLSRVAFAPFGTGQSRAAALAFGVGDDYAPAGLLAYRPTNASRFGDEESTSEFLPDFNVEDGIAHMPIVFPEGSRVIITYPESLDLSRLGLTPSVSYLFFDDRPPRFPILFLYGGRGVERPHVLGDGPLDRVVSSDGRAVEVWPAADGSELAGRDVRSEWLVFETPSWIVLVSVAERISAGDLASVLLVEEVSGFPVVRTSAPIALSDESGEGEGPAVSFNSVGGGGDIRFQLWLQACTGENLETSGRYGAACLDGRIQYDVYGPEEFVREVVEGVGLESFEEFQP